MDGDQRGNSQPFLIRISRKYVEILEKAHYKVSFPVKSAKLKIFRCTKLDDEIDPVKLLRDMKIDGPTGTDNPPM